MRAPRPEAHVAGAKDDGAVGNIQPFQDVLGAAGHAFVLSQRILGPGQRDHLDLLELVLAQHAAGVLAGRAGLGAEALGPGGVAPGQGGLVDDLAGVQVGQGHLRRRDQPPAVLGAVEVVGEFRQLPGADQHLVAHQNRRPDLGQAVHIYMNIQHKLGQRPVQPDQRAGQDDEAGAGEFGGGFEVHAPHGLAELVVLLGREGEGVRGAPAAEFLVVGLGVAVGDAVERCVGDGEHEVGEATVLGRRLGLEAGDLVLLGGHQGAEPFEFIVVAAGLGLADLARGGVALGLRGLGFGDPGPAALVEPKHLRRQRREPAAGQHGVEGGGVLADQADVVHGWLPGWNRQGYALLGPDFPAVGIPVLIHFPTGVFWWCFGSGSVVVR